MATGKDDPLVLASMRGIRAGLEVALYGLQTAQLGLRQCRSSLVTGCGAHSRCGELLSAMESMDDSVEQLKYLTNVHCGFPGKVEG